MTVTKFTRTETVALARASLVTLLQRRHFNVVVTAVANKMARTVWAVLAKGAAFDQVKWNPTETVVS